MPKKVLLVIASQNFRDEELFDTKEALEESGHETTVASTTLSEVTGMFGRKAKPEILLNDVNMDNYDAIVFIGGIGSSEYWDSSTAHTLANKAYSDGKVVAAICIAPVTLANTGLLNGKNFTVWQSEINTIKQKGGVHINKPVVIDGKIITGEGPTAATQFGKAIAENI